VAGVSARFMVDKSALARMPQERVRARLAPIIEAGEAATCGLVELEVLFSAKNHQEHQSARTRRALAYIRVPIDDATLDRAIEVQGMLARKGHHRLAIPDLIIAAAAERSKLIVLHYDADYDRIAAVTGQATEWVVPKGSAK
jgi:predicted nucleic acid-binding protein